MELESNDADVDFDFATYLGVIEGRDLRAYRASAVWESRYRQVKARLDEYVAKYGELTDAAAAKEAGK